MTTSPPSASDSPPKSGDTHDYLGRLWVALTSNASVVGAIIVLGGLYLGQGLVADWLTDDEIVDEDDIVAPLAEPAAALETDSCDPWILSFADEFDGDSVNEDNWIRYASPGANGNGIRQPDAIEVSDGMLVITGRMDDDQEGLILGGLASTHQQIYGRVEARVRTELDPSETLDGVIGTWPAGNNHPDGGDITFYQAPAAGQREPFYSYINHTDGTTEEVIHRANAQDWQEMAIEWDEDQITVFRDGDSVGATTSTDAIADVAHVVTIQLTANKPVMEEAPDSIVQLFVDWIRLYQPNEDLDSSC